MESESIVDFKLLRPDLALAVPVSDGSKGGRPPLDPDRVDLSPLAVAVEAARISADKSSLFVAGVRAESGLAVAIARLARTSVRFFGAHCRPAMNEGRLRARGHGWMKIGHV
jgi:hypothetical protein